MRWVAYVSPTTGAEAAGVVRDGEIHGAGATMAGLLARGALDPAARRAPAEVVALDAVRLLPPVPTPPSVRDYMAFEDHVVTSMAAIGRPVSPVWYSQPVFYFTNPAAVLGPDDPVPVAPGSDAFDYELEVAAVIGAPGRDIPVEDAALHIAGYTVLVDWSARDLQEREMDIGLGPVKGKDTATTIGPSLVTPDELADARSGAGFDLAMTADVNGVRYSAGNWADLSWSFEQMIAYASRGTELRPGDVIGSGTVGTGCILELARTHGHETYPWLAPGDVVTVDVERLGRLTTTIAPAAPVRPLGPPSSARRTSAV